MVAEIDGILSWTGRIGIATLGPCRKFELAIHWGGHDSLQFIAKANTYCDGCQLQIMTNLYIVPRVSGHFPRKYSGKDV